jgi:hypothetical protein
MIDDMGGAAKRAAGAAFSVSFAALTGTPVVVLH